MNSGILEFFRVVCYLECKICAYKRAFDVSVNVHTRDGNSSLRLGLESHLSLINKDLGLD